MNLENKVAVVTGVSQGIGKAIALQLIDKGAVVAGWGLHEPDYRHENLHFFGCDIREMQSVEQAFTDTATKLGAHIHILINNAGLGRFGYIEDISPEDFNEVFQVNVFGIYYTCRYVVPVMKAQQYGHIINISSIAGLEGMAQGSAYCGAKHAVRGITDSLFKELRDFNIKVTGVYPGSVNTHFYDNSPGIKAHDNMMRPEDVATQVIQALETPDNFLVNSLEFRPLHPKPRKD